MIPRGLHVHMAGESCPVRDCPWSPGAVAEPDALSTSARLAKAEQERSELLSIVARIGDAISPTGERPEEALGTLAADVEALVELRDRAEQERDEALAKRDEAIENGDYWNREWKLARAEVATARAELEQLRAERQWIVARDGGRDCVRCEQEIRRGEAYELLPGADELRHIHCPDRANPTEAIAAICGSTRFRTEMAAANRQLTLDGFIVLAPGVFGHDGDEMTAEQKAALDELHLRKIDLAELVYVVNPGGYIGESTRREIAYARDHGKRVRMLVGQPPEPDHHTEGAATT